MKQLKEYLHAIFDMFTRITTWTLFASACFISLFRKGYAIGTLLWQILGLSLLCAAATVLLFKNAENVTKKSMLLRYILSYLAVNIVMFLGGLLFDWFSLQNLREILVMLILIALGYLTVATISYYAARTEAEQMNEKLRERK